ncbi:AAA family ATPase [Desulfobacterales bacterium HSG16]|nr:AAA family ATPase [Desulfobacterales bacterium HSG16]
MYKQFFGFNERPFQLVPNPAYLFLGQPHEEALAHLNYAVTQGEGFVEITGEVGTGKTTLCRSFLDSLDKNIEVAYIFNPKLDSLQLLKAINDEFGLSSDSEHIKELIDTLNLFLMDRKAENKKVILLIDEAQNLTRDVLEQLRLLSNLETSTSKLIQIILVGQPELSRILYSYALRQLAQRITLSCHLRPLSLAETKDYIRHRLHIASNKPGVTYTKSAFRAIHKYSGGIPRLTNILCDRCLLTAYGLNTQKITGRITRIAIRELSYGKKKEASGWFGIKKEWWAASVLVLCFLAIMLLPYPLQYPTTVKKTPEKKIAPLYDLEADKPEVNIAKPESEPESESEQENNQKIETDKIDEPEDEDLTDKSSDGKALTDNSSDGKALTDNSSDGKALTDNSSDGKALTDNSSDSKALTDKNSDSKALTDNSSDDKALTDNSSDGKALTDNSSDDKALTEIKNSEQSINPAPATSQPEQISISRVPAIMDGANSRTDAFRHALNHWGIRAVIHPYLEQAPDHEEFFRLASGQNGLLSYRIINLKTKKLNTVISLNLPAIMEFKFPDYDSSVFLALYAIDKNVWSFHGPEAKYQVLTTRDEVKKFWTGRAYILWKNFYYLFGTISKKAPKASIVTLKILLQDIGYNQLTINGDYDDKTREAVLRIQVKYGIKPDGIAGPMTKIVLYNELRALHLPKLKQ